MTASGGGPAVPDADAAAPSGSHARAGLSTRSRGPRLRTVLALARVEATMLARSLLTLAGLIAGGAMVFLVIGRTEPLWWNAGWRIGSGQLVLGMTVLVAAQLAAGRARRNAMRDLYASFPATAGTRTLGHLGGLAGAAPASLLLIAAAAVLVQLHGAIGTPGFAVLAGGLLLVIAAGSAGIAIGVRFPHPLAGVLGALVLLVSSGQSHLPGAAGLWLYPWESFSDQLAVLPGPLAGYPPAAAHALELAGLAALAGVVALTVTVRPARARAWLTWGWLAGPGIIAVAVISLAGALQLRPIPTDSLNQLVSEVADPASVQRCTAAGQVRYCVYPGFGSLVPSLEAPVSAVLAHVPAGPARQLTIRQVVPLSLPDPTLTHGHPSQQVSRWIAQVRLAPGTVSAVPASAIYLPVGDWPAADGDLADAHFGLALAAADWAVHLTGTSVSSAGEQPCVPLGQAREAIAIWLAILAAHPPASELQAGLGSGAGVFGTEVDNTFVRTWTYPGVGGYVTPPGGGLQNTADGYLLANAMTSLKEQNVRHVLASAWSRWLSWHTTDAQLAAALGIPMPGGSATPALPSGKTIEPGPANGPQSPLCTS